MAGTGIGDRRRGDRTARLYAVGLLIAFLALAALVVLRWPPLVDRDLATDVAVHAVVLRDQVLLTTAVIVTNAGSPVSVNIITALVAGGLLYRRRMGAAVYLVAARLVELGVETAAKHLISRPRPVLSHPVGHASSFSFPSGHAAGTAVLCASLLVLALPGCRRRAPWTAPAGVALAGVAIAAVATSRVLLGVHFPSDVLGGALLGIACALLLRPLLAVGGPRVVTVPERESPA
jgi:undecaprenyl-diphosphatase